MLVVGCGPMSDAAWRAALEIPESMQTPAGTSEYAVGCEHAQGILLHSRPPVVAICTEGPQHRTMVVWIGDRLLLLRSPSSPALVHVRSPEEMRALAAPLRSAEAALGYLFAVSQFDNYGFLLDAHHVPGEFARDNDWEVLDGLKGPTISEGASGWTIEWPSIRGNRDGCGVNLVLVTVYVGVDGSIRREPERIMAQARGGICAVSNAKSHVGSTSHM